MAKLQQTTIKLMSGIPHFTRWNCVFKIPIVYFSHIFVWNFIWGCTWCYSDYWFFVQQRKHVAVFIYFCMTRPSAPPSQPSALPSIVSCRLLPSRRDQITSMPQPSIARLTGDDLGLSLCRAEWLCSCPLVSMAVQVTSGHSVCLARCSSCDLLSSLPLQDDCYRGT